MSLENVKLNSLTFNHILRLVREVAVIGVCSYLAIRIFSGDLSLDFTKLSPSELVSILLAFFSIALSALFYFAATNASNNFYDNINKFNKDTSELLGRLDEQIKHVNTRQKELGDRIDRSYISHSDTSDESDKNEQELAKAQDRWEKTLKKIIDSATIKPEEKIKLEEELKRKDEELSTLREAKTQIEASKLLEFKRVFYRRIYSIGLEEAASFSPSDLFLKLSRRCSPSMRSALYRYGYLNVARPSSPDHVTEKGEKMISSLVREMLNGHELDNFQV